MGFSFESMKPQIPEEIEAMAALLGQSAAIDSMIIDAPVGLNTNSNTIKQSIAQYVQQQRSGYQPQTAQPPIVPIPNHVTPQELPQLQQFSPMPQYQQPKVDDGQLEFNLEPSKADEIIILLKEISQKLTKQNSLIEKYYDNSSQKGRVPETPIKLRADK